MPEGRETTCNCGHDGLDMEWHLTGCPVIEFCACGNRLRNCNCGELRCFRCDPLHSECWEEVDV